MDTASQFALRAIVRGLFHSDAIDPHQVRAIVSALKDAAAEAAERRKPQDAHELVALAKGIRADTAV
jgi:hypothetical protein